MFDDKHGLTQAVLDGRKTMTRRIIKCPRTFRGEWVAGFNIHRSPSDKKIVGFPCMYDADEREFDMGEILPKYELGEVVAIAQSYDSFYDDSCDPRMFPSGVGWTNKMFVKADLMPHHIEITGIKVERLQDISDEDCLKEGVNEDAKGVQYSFDTNIGYCEQYPFDAPRDAFANLINKVSGKGTWESNPFVWVYEFKLLD